MEFIYQEKDKERLDKYLLGKLPDVSRSQIKKIILSGQITVNGTKSTVHHWLKNGYKIKYNPQAENKETTFIAEPKIIEQNDEFLIIDKPHGLLVHPTDRGE